MLPRFEVASSRPLEVKHSVSSTLHDVSAKKQADAAKQQGIMKEGRCFFLMERPLVKPHPNLFFFIHVPFFRAVGDVPKVGHYKKERLTFKTKVTMALCGDAPCFLSLVSHNTQTIQQRCRGVVCFCSFFARLKSKNACKLLAYKRFSNYCCTQTRYKTVNLRENKRT